MSLTRTLHIITPEYPPEPGGVSDFCRIMAEGLVERGLTVEVWCPPIADQQNLPGLTIHQTLGDFGRAALAETDRVLDAFPKPRRLLVQWVPHGYGWKAMNLPFCWWVYRRMRRGDVIDLMVHEAFVTFTGKIRHRLMAAVHRLMVYVILRAGKRVWCSIPKWEHVLRPYAPKFADFRRLPVPSCVPQLERNDPIEPIAHEFTFGHFSSLGVSTAQPMFTILPELLSAMPEASVLLIGLRSQSFRDEFLRVHDSFRNRIIATGSVPLQEVPKQLHRCQVMLQAVMGGASGRNTSLLASLANGMPMITTTGRLTEPYWAESGAVALAPDGDVPGFVRETIRVTNSPEDQMRFCHAGVALNDNHFHPRLLIEAITAAVATDRF